MRKIGEGQGIEDGEPKDEEQKDDEEEQMDEVEEQADEEEQWCLVDEREAFT
jgi:hypothetical protein